jgi:hypothetical protein
MSKAFRPAALAVSGAALYAAAVFVGYTLAAGSSGALLPSLASDARPPVRYQGNARARVVTMSPAAVNGYCAAAPNLGAPPPGYHWGACTTADGIMFLPNPCLSPPTDEYAHLLCHELGHVNGWPPTHGN